MRAIAVLRSQKFGVPVCVGIAVLAWLEFTTITGCWFLDNPAGYSGPTSGCNTKSPMASLVDDGIWPLQYAPFSAYWDVYDDKFAWLMNELYFRLIVFGIVIYGIWFGLTFFVRKRYDKAAALTNS
ncbi:MAG: hypothetical protein ACREBU_18360 [Nitrososphaera sp.]